MSKSKNKNHKSKSANPKARITLIVIGASLGGLKALQTVLSALPRNFPAAIAIVQHRKSGADERLVELLQRHCALTVSEPEDKEPVREGRVYVAPSDYHLMVEAGHFALSTEPPVNHACPAIDVLFETAASACGPGVIGVLLTGASADGAAGLAAIRRAGGPAVAQDIKSAEATAMPEAAILSGAADVVMPLEEIGSYLVRLVMHMK